MPRSISKRSNEGSSLSRGLSFPRLGFDVAAFVPPSWAEKEFACGLCVFLDDPAWGYADAGTAALALIGGVRAVYGPETALEALHVAGSPLAALTPSTLLEAAGRAWNMAGWGAARRARAAKRDAERESECKAPPCRSRVKVGQEWGSS